MKKLIYTALLLSMMAAFAFSDTALAQKAVGQAVIGNITVNLTGPEGLTRVDGRFPQADAYIKTVEPKFKLQVLAIYAVESEWKAFIEAAAKGQPTSIPKYAMLCIPQKMPTKSFDSKKVRQEFKKYDNWFSMAASNKPMAKLLTSRGNKKLKENMGVDIGFKFHTDKYTTKFAETSGSMSLGAQVSFDVFGQPSSVYLTVTALNLADKLVYLAYFEKTGQPEVLSKIQAESLAWRSAVSSANSHL